MNGRVSSVDPLPRDRPALEGLTPRQREVLQLVARGFTNAAIAEALVLAKKSVENQLNAIYQQLGIAANDPRHNPRVTVALFYLRENQLSAEDLWATRFRGGVSADHEGAGEELSDEDLREVVGGSMSAEAFLLDLVASAHALG